MEQTERPRLLTKRQNEQKAILIVDDEPIVLEFVSAILSVEYTILSAVNGADAIRRSNEFPGKIDVLLSDFQMPEMTGIELATHICEVRPEVRILLMSGFTGGMLVLNEGWHFLPKPFIPSQLRAIVSNLLNGGKPFMPPR